MKTLVLNFGGFSFGTNARIKKVCKIIAYYKKNQKRVVVISSAMSGVTNDLIKKSKLISPNFDNAEYDTLLSTGEQTSCSLIAGGLNHIGLTSRTRRSWQVQIQSHGTYTSCKLIRITAKESKKDVKKGGIQVSRGSNGKKEK